MSDWQRVCRAPVSLKRHRFLVVREPYLQLMGTEPGAKFLYWLEWQTKMRLVDVAESEGLEAYESLLRRLEAGEVDPRTWTTRSHAEICRKDFFGTISRNTLRDVRTKAVEKGWIQEIPGDRQTNAPSRWHLLARPLAASLRELGYQKPDPLADALAEAESGPGALLNEAGSELREAGSGSPEGGSDLHEGGVQDGARAGADVHETSLKAAPLIDGGSTSTTLMTKREEAASRPSLSLLEISDRTASRAKSAEIPEWVEPVDLNALTPAAGAAGAVTAARSLVAGECSTLVLCGTAEEGTTVLAGAVAWALCAKGKKVSWVDAAEAANALATSFEGQAFKQMASRLSADRALILDDLDAVKHREAKRRIGQTVKSRIASKLPIVITTELAAEELEEAVGANAARRLERVGAIWSLARISEEAA